MTGGGVKPGFSYGATDEYGFYALEDKVHVHDLHATMLALLGVDHERLTYRMQVATSDSPTSPGAWSPRSSPERPRCGLSFGSPVGVSAPREESDPMNLWADT